MAVGVRSRRRRRSVEAVQTIGALVVLPREGVEPPTRDVLLPRRRERVPGANSRALNVDT